MDSSSLKGHPNVRMWLVLLEEIFNLESRISNLEFTVHLENRRNNVLFSADMNAEQGSNDETHTRKATLLIPAIGTVGFSSMGYIFRVRTQQPLLKQVAD